MSDHDNCDDDSSKQEQLVDGISQAMGTIDSLTGLDKEDHEQVWRSRTKMAWCALWAVILPTIYIIMRVNNTEVIDKLGVMMSWYYLSLASIVGAYFGFRSWSSIQGK